MALAAVVHRLAVSLVALAACVFAMLGNVRVARFAQVGGASNQVVTGHSGAIGVCVAAGVQAELVFVNAASLPRGQTVRDLQEWSGPSCFRQQRCKNR